MSEQPAANSDETEIRSLIERWLEAVQARRIEEIVAAHSDDVVMYDVPLPNVNGIDEYRESFLRMFPYLGEHGTFKAKDLTVTAGEDVAFCFGQLHCQGSEPDSKPLSIRLTVGLRKHDDGRWIVEHEHHSEATPD